MPSLADYASMVARITYGWNVALTFEPGHIITGLAGVLLTRLL